MAKVSQRFDTRQHMKNDTFEVFRYYDAKPDGVDVHHHDFYEIYFFLGGEVEYRIEGRTYRLQPGDLLLINPSEFHRPVVEAGAPYERIVLWINRNFLSQISGDEIDLAGCFSGSVQNLLRPTRFQKTNITALFDALVRENYSSGFASGVYAKGIFMQLLVEINRMARQTSRQKGPVEELDLVNMVLAYIGSHYWENITLDMLSEQFYVSKYYLSHEFTSRVGISVYRYIILKRLLEAREMLAAGRSSGEVCISCGFRDYANFYRAFKAEYGVSPREYVNMANE